jgi:hypothetical protein
MKYWWRRDPHKRTMNVWIAIALTMEGHNHLREGPKDANTHQSGQCRSGIPSLLQDACGEIVCRISIQTIQCRRSHLPWAVQKPPVNTFPSWIHLTYIDFANDMIKSKEKRDSYESECYSAGHTTKNKLTIYMSVGCRINILFRMALY